MLEIFDKYIDRSFEPTMKLDHAYAKIKNISDKWVSTSFGSKTIQEIIDHYCDELEKEGFDLSRTDVKHIRERFATIEFVVNIPEEWISLKLALDEINNVIPNADGSLVVKLEEIKVKIINNMKLHQ